MTCCSTVADAAERDCGSLALNVASSSNIEGPFWSKRAVSGSGDDVSSSGGGAQTDGSGKDVRDVESSV